MIVAIPVDDDRETICVSFGRAPYFLIHHSETGATELVGNPAAEAQGGAGIQAAQLVADQGANALITVRCGQNAAKVFQAAGIAVYKADGLSAAENLNALSEGKLSVLTSFHAGFHGRA
ncbi:MAG: NifB/NifX family molybdenum-iron cluster-binding protein [Oscillospiraceae bacterium]|nr:NifB/NifX family molybdenum-iron cluster-binding protein [Oscillospiraceae bacterium]